MLRRALLCAAVSVGPVAGAAAADLPNRYRGPDLFSPAPAATWTGLYVGAQVGYGFGSDQTLVNVSGFPFSFVGPDHDLSGPVGGIHAGFNFQNGPIVYGLEGDLELANADGTISLAGSGGFAGLGLTSRTSIDWQGSLRGRLGFAMFERAMIYGTAGLAFSASRQRLRRAGGHHGRQVRRDALGLDRRCRRRIRADEQLDGAR
jgi:outer membrane immunogenic protein